ncbi:MAG: VWA domain-containing protein [Alistipes sp.]|nr:VWA domain-containing protein [Alistipes sp.]
MSTERFAGESAVNQEQKCLCVFVLDVSGSMRGAKLDALNQGMKDFYNEIQCGEGGISEKLIEQLEVAVIQYDEEVKILREPKLLDEEEIPPVLEERGSTTETVVAMEEAIKMVEDRKAWYKETGQKYYRPWIVVMTDGEPYGNRASQSDIDNISSRVAADTAAKKYFMMGIGVGEANMELLGKMCGGKALPLSGTKFTEFFKWLSNSLSMVSTSKEGDKVNISQGADAWMDSFEI